MVQNRPTNRGDNKGGRMSRKHWVALGLAIATASVLSATAGATTRTAGTPELTKVTLQLKWVTQAQFAGYYAALQKGYYKQAGLDVKIKTGGPTITPETVVIGGQADIGLDWLPNLFATRAKVGEWCCGNQPELFAALNKNGIDPNNPSDVTIFNQPFDMVAFLSHQIDAAAAMTYNELAQVLETKNPKTGKLYQLSDLNVFKMASPTVGTGMLEDNLFVRDDWLSSSTNQGTLVKFLKASFQGWIWCRDHQTDCVRIVLKNGPTLGRGHQTWQMNEINALIWPNASGIGVVPASQVSKTANIAKTYGVIKSAPSGATNYTYARRALAQVKATGADVYGKSWRKANVKVTAGGK